MLSINNRVFDKIDAILLCVVNVLEYFWGPPPLNEIENIVRLVYESGFIKNIGFCKLKSKPFLDRIWQIDFV